MIYLSIYPRFGVAVAMSKVEQQPVGAAEIRAWTRETLTARKAESEAAEAATTLPTAAEPRTLSSLPAELLAIVAEKLAAEGPLAYLVRFAAASALCLAAAQAELRGAVLEAQEYWLGPQWDLCRQCFVVGYPPEHARFREDYTWIWNTLANHPYFRLPKDLVTIPPRTFEGLSLTQLAIPGTVTTIGEQAFKRTLFTELTLPAALTTIDHNAFEECTSLIELNLADTTITTIGIGAFWNCTSLTSVTLPSALTIVSQSAFYRCTSLTSVTLPSALTIIGKTAFAHCTSPTELTFPSSLATIGNRAFEGCASLNYYELALPASLIDIGLRAFDELGGEGSPPFIPP